MSSFVRRRYITRTMNLDTALRTTLTGRILRRLVEAAPGSAAILRGSLAGRRADQYSDIDVLWDVPDRLFQPCVEHIANTLSPIYPIESIRSDLDFQHSAKRRLFFARFADVPLFWRLDLDVFAQSVGRDPSYDVANPAARGTAWSFAESALANAVAAVKAYVRGNEQEAQQILARAYTRIGLAVPQLPLPDLIIQLTDEAPCIDPGTRSFASRIKDLVAEVF